MQSDARLNPEDGDEHLTQHPNPFARAFQAADAHMFEAQIAAHMRDAALREGQKQALPGGAKNSRLSPSHAAVMDALIDHGPQMVDEIAARLDRFTRDTVSTAISDLSQRRAIRQVGKVGNFKIWEAARHDRHE